MMWLILAFASAALLGCYDTLKKVALKDNAVIPVLFFNTFFSSLIFLPLILLSGATNVLDDSIFHVGSGGWEMHKYIVLKAILVLSSWILGYFAMKNLPLTIVGPINATNGGGTQNRQKSANMTAFKKRKCKHLQNRFSSSLHFYIR